MASRAEILRSNDVALLKRELKKAWNRGDAVLGKPEEAVTLGGQGAGAPGGNEDASNPNQLADFKRLSQSAKKANR